MNVVAPEAIAYTTNLTFNFSNTLKDQPINLDDYSSANFVIDIDGQVYQGQPVDGTNSTTIIIGGIDRFINGSNPNRLVSNFYLTEPQKVVLYRIMKDLAIYTDSATITSDSDKLQQSLTALYTNYSG
jgi:hypothetical protein